jgi:hypothetical protein
MARNITPPRQYHFFILSLWTQPDHQPGQATAWRISLENPHTAERTGFTTVNDLAAYLTAWMAQRTNQTDWPGIDES